MTCCAPLKLRCLVVKIRRPRCAAEAGSRVAPQAKNVQVAGFEQTWIWRTMRRMAGYTTFRLNPLMLENKRSLFVYVACEANRVTRGR